MKLEICQLGRVAYPRATALQEKLVLLRQENKIGDLLLLLEHPPVITVGKAKRTDHILMSQAWLEDHQVEVCFTNRGGDVTYHGPGQLIGYPIMDLTNHGKDIRKFIRTIEEVFIQLLQVHYQISAVRDPLHPGVWVDQGKITAVGFAVKRWVTMHGFAFNVNTDLSHFRWIVPCGIEDKGVCSLKSLLNEEVPLDTVTQQLIDTFARVFHYQQPTLIPAAQIDHYLRGANYGEA